MKKLLVLSFVFFSCSSPEVSIPSTVIPRDSMVAILADIHLIEATIQIKGLGRFDTLKAEAYGRFRYLFEKYHITNSRFKESLEYYRSEPEYFHLMYDDVLTRLSEEQAKRTNLKAPPAVQQH